VVSLRSGQVGEQENIWSPQINIGASVLIPDGYVPDLNVRMSLYRRLGDLEDAQAIEAFAVELIDRFGPLPEEVDTLLKIVGIKQLCRAAHVEKLEAGPKGATLTSRNNAFARPDALVHLITEHSGTMRVRPDQKLVIMRNWDTPEARIKGTKAILTQLVHLAEAA